ncbi:hypothetical protein HZH66_015507 [Vespula vulgaris]|uniref:Thioester reductase (TE) domain-containing protein n=1 Tax=Vespula vulgaris TaxID=7454 RepID=A0A834MME4_VESVU|nr:hypothetical protein HZH66_015507 [Vespula vulgaris]
MKEVPMKEYEQEIAFKNINNLSPIREFYYDENIFMIERTGFIGKFLIEKSLRTDPDTNHIYLLILPKKEENALTHSIIFRTNCISHEQYFKSDKFKDNEKNGNMASMERPQLQKKTCFKDCFSMEISLKLVS